MAAPLIFVNANSPNLWPNIGGTTENVLKELPEYTLNLIFKNKFVIVVSRFLQKKRSFLFGLPQILKKIKGLIKGIFQTDLDINLKLFK